MIPKYAPGDLKATAYGLYYAVIGMSFLAANTIVGTLWEYQGIQAAFTYSSVTSILAIIGIVLFAKVHRLGR
jgi:dipeptide/tripeptide permease